MILSGLGQEPDAKPAPAVVAPPPQPFKVAKIVQYGVLAIGALWLYNFLVNPPARGAWGMTTAGLGDLGTFADFTLAGQHRRPRRRRRR